MDPNRCPSPSRWLVFASLALALVLPACGGSPATAGDPQLQGDWVLVTGEGPDGPVLAPPSHPITLSIDDDRWSGTAACNRYEGRVELRGEQLTIHGLSATEMACPEDGVMAAEAAYLAAFAAVTSATTDGSELVLRGPDVGLRFARPDPAAG